MKSAIVEAPGKMAVREVREPTIGGNDALVKVAYTGICGSDIHVYLGESPVAKPDVVVGHEYSGIICEIAENASNPENLKVGDKVVGWIVEACGECDACIGGHTNLCYNLKCYGTQIDGTFREYISAPLKLLHKIPDDADLRLYALVEPMAVAVYAVRETPMLAGDRVLVIGGGPIGLCTAIVARMSGASMVVVSEMVNEKIKRIRDIGFEVINPMEGDPVAAAKAMTKGKGFNCVMEASASAAGYALMTKVGAYRSTGMNIGVTYKPLPLIPRDIMVTEMNIKAIRIHQQAVFNLTADMFDSMDEALKNDLEKLISDDYDFAHIVEAFEFSQKDKTHCKVMVKVMSDSV